MAISTTTLQKYANEVRSYVFDFSQFPEVVDGETLSSPTVPAVSGLAIGSPTVLTSAVDYVASGKGIKVTISGGTAGTSYTVVCRATTSGGATLEVDGTLVVN